MAENKNENSQAQEDQLSKQAHVMCGWPLALVFIGGAIGGGLGGGAYAINLKIYKSSLPNAAKIALNILTGVAAVVIWAVAVYMLRGSGE